MSRLEIREITIPDAADAPDASDFLAAVDVRNRVDVVVRGESGLVVTPAEVLPSWRDQTDERLRAFLVVDGAEAVGRVMVYLPNEVGSAVAEVRVEVLPERWGAGIGREAYAHAESAARAEGRTIVRGWSDHAEVGGPRIPAATGWGAIPEDHIARAVAGAGFALEQVYRASALDLDAALSRVPELLAQARRAAAAYRYVSWSIPTPPEYRDAYARLKSRMSTDAPSGDVVWDEEAWDAERIVRWDDRRISLGFTGIIGAAEHVASGELAAFTELYHRGEPDAPSHQNDTLVLAEHRGHRLGMLVKCETLLRWREVAPHSTRVLTHNAEENRPMLDINEAMGFIPTSYSGMWQKVLDPTP